MNPKALKGKNCKTIGMAYIRDLARRLWNVEHDFIGFSVSCT